MKKLLMFFCAVVLVFGVIGNVNAALIDRGGGLISDPDQNIIWLQDYVSYGVMTFGQACEWADGLEYYDSVRDVWLNDWRIATWGEYNYIHMVYGNGPPEWDPDLVEAPFNDIPDWGHWTSSPVDPLLLPTGANPADYANYYLSQAAGYGTNISNTLYVCVVHALVPIPGAIWLLGSGLVGLIGIRQKFKEKASAK